MSRQENTEDEYLTVLADLFNAVRELDCASSKEAIQVVCVALGDVKEKHGALLYSNKIKNEFPKDKEKK